MKNILNTIKNVALKTTAAVTIAATGIGASYQSAHAWPPTSTDQFNYWSERVNEREIEKQQEKQKELERRQRELEERQKNSYGEEREMSQYEQRVRKKYFEGKEDVFLTCGDWDDKNRDGEKQFNELKDIRNVFEEGEKFFCVAIPTDNGMDREGYIEKVILDSKEQPITYQGEPKIDKKIFSQGKILAYPEKIYLKKGVSSENYTILYYSQNKFLGGSLLKIVEQNQLK